MVAGMGELHLDVVLERLRREYGVQVRKGRPWVAYKETIARAVAAVEGEFIHQTGGRGQYGRVILACALASALRHPLRETIRGGVIPAQFIPAVERGVRDAAQTGVLGGHEVTDLAVRLEGGSTHPVDSSELAYRTAAAAFRDGLRQGEPVLLEPLFRIEVLVPSDYTGSVLSQLAARRAEIDRVESRPGGIEAIAGQVPLPRPSATSRHCVRRRRVAACSRWSSTITPRWMRRGRRRC